MAKLRRRRKRGGPPPCPRPGHEGSEVRFDGTYGSGAQRRQQYKCWPPDGDRPHRFTETLPRQRTTNGECYECERVYAGHEGPPTPRLYEFSTREVAAALARVGEGMSYRRAAKVVRERAGRPRLGEDGEPVLSRHAQLVCDWVEIFAPVVFERFRPQIEARYAPVVVGEGTLILDAVPFHIRRPDRRPGGDRVFSVFSALAATPKGASLVRWQPFHGEQGRCAWEWERFLGSLPGAPARVVCDLDDDILPAVERLWPQTDLYLCEWHLRERLRVVLYENGHSGGAAAGLLEQAFWSLQGWKSFVAEARKLRVKQLDQWIVRRGTLVEWQLSRRPGPWAQGRGQAVATGPLEQKQKLLREWIGPRAFQFTNRARLDRLLMLIQLHIDGYANEPVYSAAIRDWLRSNGGRPRAARRAITDPRGAPSLRPPR
jgi:hypothetical protein